MVKMKNYSGVIKNLSTSKTKKVDTEAIDVYLAHKQLLKHTNQLQEDITHIYQGDRLVYTLISGFKEIHE